MTWKKVFEYEGSEVMQAIAHAAMEVSNGGHYRILIDERIEECCEKWRGAQIWRSSFSTCGSTSACSSVGPCYPAFCPDCGGKL